MKDLYLKEGLKDVSRILTCFCDNPLSPMYGSMDREYWHYKTMDFPCGMNQEFVLPLALVYSHELDKRFYGKKRIRDMVDAGIAFASRTAHPDGSCDDYYPNEKALGATAFSLYAFTESCLLIEGLFRKHKDFLSRRAEWLASSRESGVLANHHAIVAAAMYNMYLLTKEELYRDAAYAKVKEVLEYQHEEGWFLEYTGCDTGYLTFTLDFLAKLYKKSKDEKLLEPIKKAVDLLQHFTHPDGSFGGEYNSRNTYIFLPDGLEIIGNVYKPALTIADSHLKGLANGKKLEYADSRIFGHFCYNYLQAHLDYCDDRSETTGRAEDKFFPAAGLLSLSKGEKRYIASLRKGGVVKVFDKNGCVFSNTGFLLKGEDDKLMTNVLFDPDAKVNKDGDTYTIRGKFCYYKDTTPGFLKNVIFKTFLLTLGRSYAISRWVRKFLQKMLITGRKEAPISFEMRISPLSESVRLSYRIIPEEQIKLTKGFVTTNFNPLYIAMGDCYQDAFLEEWKELDLSNLNSGSPLEMEMRI